MNNTRRCLVFSILMCLAASAPAFFGIRAGLGQFVPVDSTIKDAYANAYMADIRYHIAEPFFITGGAKFYNVHSSNLPVSAGGALTVGSLKHRVDAFGVFAGVGVGKLLGKSGIGIYPYACGAVGFISPIVSQQVEYYAFGDTIMVMLQLQDDRRWAFLANPHAGIEVRFLGFGVFAQADYFWGNAVEYDPIEVEGETVFPGGELKPSGWAIYIGLLIE